MSPAGPSPITSRPPQIEFTNRFVQPPSNLYVFRDDKLFVVSLSLFASLTFGIRGRLLTPKGEVITIDFTFTTSATIRTPAQVTFDLQEGFLLGLTLVSPLTVLSRGLLYATCGITRGGDPPGAITEILFAGYMEGANAPSWPLTGIESPTSGAGSLRPQNVVDPVAGAEWTLVVPTGVRWRVIGARFVFTTTATAIDRHVRLLVQEGANILMIPGADRVHPASKGFNYNVAANGFPAAATAGIVTIPLPGGLMLQRGMTLRTATVSIQSGDTFTSIWIYVEEWLGG